MHGHSLWASDMQPDEAAGRRTDRGVVMALKEGRGVLINSDSIGRKE